MKKLTECFDQWTNLPTYVLADGMDVDSFKPMLNKCTSLDDFEDKVRNNINSRMVACTQQADCIKDNEPLHIMLLATINDIDVEQLVKNVMNCFDAELRVFKLEKRINNLYNLMLEKKTVNERSTTEPHEGEIAAFNIATKFKKDDVDVDSAVDLKNKKDAWTLRLIYNDATKDELTLSKDSDDGDDFTITSNNPKDKLNVKFKDDDKDDKLKIPEEVIKHIQQHIENAEKANADSRKNDNRDLAHEISFEIKKNFPNYDMEIIEGDNSNGKWNLEVVYANGEKDSFTIVKLGPSYVMKSKDSFIAKYTLDELRNFPQKLQDHIQQHVKKSKK